MSTDALKQARDALKPCPFCGHDTPEFERMGTPRQSCIVVCGDCGARHESSDEGENSGRSWNTRADAAQAAPVGYVNGSALRWLHSPDRGTNAHIQVGIFKTPGEECTTPIYTAAPPAPAAQQEPAQADARVPLTQTAIIEAWGPRSDGPNNSEIISFARAIERAHGIGQAKPAGGAHG